MWPRRLVPALLLVGALLAPGAATAAVAPEFFGVTYDRVGAEGPAPAQAASFQLMRRSGVGAVRAVFSWDRAQPVRGQPVDYTSTDALVAAAAKARIDLLPIVMYAPAWARRAPATLASAPRNPATYAAFLGRLVDRYGRGGSFWTRHPELPPRPVRAWQIWNEPELVWQWDPAPGTGTWQQGYTALLKRAYRAVKRHDPHARVVLAGLTNVSWRDLARLYDAGARGWFDVAAVHVYTSSVANAFKVVRLFRTVMRRHGDRRRPLWMTEVSWPAALGRSTPGDGLRPVITTDEGMAARLRTLYTRGIRQRRALRLERLYWYSWGTSYEGPNSFEYAGLGAVHDGVFSPRPALRAFSRVGGR